MTLAERRARLFAELCPYGCEIPNIEERVEQGLDCWSVWVDDCFYVVFDDLTHEAGYMEDEIRVGSMDWGVLSYTASFLTTMADTLLAVLEQLPDGGMRE